MSFSIHKYKEVAPQKRQALEDLFYTELTHQPLYQGLEWATPNYTALFETDHEWLSAFHIVSRFAWVDGQKLHIAGIGHLYTKPDFRHRHIATLGLSEAETFIFDTIKAELGLVLCVPTLIPFFERLGWLPTAAQVVYQQKDTQKVWPGACLVLPTHTPLHDIRMPIHHIDIMGRIF